MPTPPPGLCLPRVVSLLRPQGSRYFGRERTAVLSVGAGAQLTFLDPCVTQPRLLQEENVRLQRLDQVVALSTKTPWRTCAGQQTLHIPRYEREYRVARRLWWLLSSRCECRRFMGVWCRSGAPSL